MDSNALGHLEFFAVPNNQTAKAVDQTLGVIGATPTLSPSLWNSETSGSGPPTTAYATVPASDNLEAVGQPSPTSLFDFPPNQPSSPCQTNRILPVQAPRAAERRERKRSKLSMKSAPFDSIDYWMHFDDRDSLVAIPESSGLLQPTSSPADRPARPRSDSFARLSTHPIGPLAFRTEDFVNDSPLDKTLPDDEDIASMNLAEQLAQIETAPPSEVPQREGLYSTPLSWERPQPGLRLESLIGLNSPMLNEQEQQRLIAIAMNTGPSMRGLGSNLNLNFDSLGSGFNTTLGAEFGTAVANRLANDAQVSKAEPQNPAAPSQQKKHGAGSGSSSKGKGKEKEKLGERTAHHDIERKYRTNLKDKIAELRDAVPALHTISENPGGEDDGSQPARTAKVSKGTVLLKATEYIHYLEQKNKEIVQEHRELSRRLQAFEQLLRATARPSFQMPSCSKTLFDPRAFC